MVSTHLKNISKIGSFPQVGMKIKKYVKPPARSWINRSFLERIKLHQLRGQSQPTPVCLFFPMICIKGPKPTNLFEPSYKCLKLIRRLIFVDFYPNLKWCFISSNFQRFDEEVHISGRSLLQASPWMIPRLVNQKASLLQVQIDSTNTSMQSRLIKHWYKPMCRECTMYF